VITASGLELEVVRDDGGRHVEARRLPEGRPTAIPRGRLGAKQEHPRTRIQLMIPAAGLWDLAGPELPQEMPEPVVLGLRDGVVLVGQGSTIWVFRQRSTG